MSALPVTTKKLSDQDGDQTLRSAYNAVDATFSTNGFLVGQVGNTVVVTITTTNLANDSEVYTFSDIAHQLYQLKLVYTDGTRTTLMSATRIS